MSEMRLISASELYELIEEEFDGACVYDVEPSEAVNHFQSIVDLATTVDAEPVRHGHWIDRTYIYPSRDIEMHVCSECRYEYSYDVETGISDANYCPNCGAKMDE